MDFLGRSRESSHRINEQGKVHLSTSPYVRTTLGVGYNVGCGKLLPTLAFLRSQSSLVLFSESRDINAYGIIDPRWAFGSDDTDSGHIETSYSIEYIDGQHI